MFLAPGDLVALGLTFRLAATVTLILLVVGTPVAWWLARTRSWWKGPIGAVVALPLVLPPSVLGFYLLLAMGPDGPAGRLTEWLGLGLLPFTFWGLVVASVFYSLPFMVQPLKDAFAAVGSQMTESAATLRAGPWDRFFNVVVPLSRRPTPSRRWASDRSKSPLPCGPRRSMPSSPSPSRWRCRVS